MGTVVLYLRHPERGWACRPTHIDKCHILEALLKTKELVSDVRRSPDVLGRGEGSARAIPPNPSCRSFALKGGLRMTAGAVFAHKERANSPYAETRVAELRSERVTFLKIAEKCYR